MTLAALIAVLQEAWTFVQADTPEERTIEALLNALKKAREEGAE